MASTTTEEQTVRRIHVRCGDIFEGRREVVALTLDGHKEVCPDNAAAPSERTN